MSFPSQQRGIKFSMIKFEKREKMISIAIIVIAIILVVFFMNFKNNNYKTVNIGNNNLNKTLEEVEDYILNINLYKAVLEVTIKSNKNTNKYILSQVHTQNEDVQEVIAPENIKGVKITYKDSSLKVENTNLKLEKIYNNYPYIESNNLWLNSFIETYKNSQNKNIFEQDNEIIMQVQIKDDSKIKYKELHLDRKTLKPTKLLIQDNDKNEIIYILYNEIELNK